MTDYPGLNARAFGAKGDGKSDDTQALQRALDAAAETSDTVMLPAGVYLTGRLKMSRATGLCGLPAWSYRSSNGSVLRCIDPDAPCLLDLTGAIGATVTGVCLHGNQEEGTDNRTHGILIDKEDYGVEEDTPRIDGCRIECFGGDGIRLDRIWCFTVRHSQCFHNGGCGLRVRGWDGFVLDNWFSGNREVGFATCEENASTTLTGNRIEWNRQGGIVIRGGWHYNITGNYIDRSGRAGIALVARGNDGCKAVAATGNVIYRSGKPEWGTEQEYDSAQVRCEGANGLVLTGNTMNAGRDDGGQGAFSPDYGMVLSGLNDSVVKDNVMHQGALKDLIVDLGGHGPNAIIRDNVGSLKAL